MWVNGVDSHSDPRLGDGWVQRAWNVVFRAGAVRTRPGTKVVHRLPDGRLQGFTHFEPRRGAAQLVAVVDGEVWVSSYPFRAWKSVGVLLQPRASTVYFCRVVQSIERNADDSLRLLGAPRPMLVLQDGNSPPVVWDGSAATRQTGPDALPQGTAMAWSGHRLWVARDNWVFASDFANPLSFVERFYLGGADSLFAPGRVTAMAEIEGTSDPQLLVFTEGKTLIVQSSVPREDWVTTPNFSRTLFPEVGCVSHRSVISHYGQLWWWTSQGLTSFDLAVALNNTSLFPVTDGAQTYSKAHVTASDAQVAVSSIENMLLVSVPYAGRLNRHTWVLDHSPLGAVGGKTQSAWSGVWHGFSPVEWTRFVVDGAERVFCACTDTGSRNQILELSPRFDTDNGRDIEAGVELRVHTHGSPDMRVARFAELAWSEVLGDVDWRVDWRGIMRGRYKQCAGGRFRAGRGSVRQQDVPTFFAMRGQARRVRTTEMRFEAPDVLANCAEGATTEERDFGFGLLVRWNGRAALREVRDYVSGIPESNTGKCVTPETDTLYVRFDGGASADGSFDATSTAGKVFTATQSASATVNGTTATATRVARSVISQEAADKVARQAAGAQVARTLFLNSPPIVGAIST